MTRKLLSFAFADRFVGTGRSFNETASVRNDQNRELPLLP